MTARWTYGALEDVVLRMAEGLRRRGFEGGERLFLRMGNSIDYALMFFAANAAGAVPIPASAALTAPEVSRLLADSRPRGVAWDGILALPACDGVIGPDEIAALKIRATRRLCRYVQG